MSIIYHKHHIIPKHMGGTDDPKNIIKVNTTMHAFLHKLLWEEHGNQYDFIAWKCLSGQITNEEANIMATRVANTGRKWNEYQKKMMPEISRRLNEKRLKNGTHNFLNGEFQRNVQLIRMKEGTHHFLNSEKQRELAMRQVRSGNHMSFRRMTCEKCGIETNTGNYHRWHGSKCKPRKYKET